MAIDELSNAWLAYRREIDRFYEVARPALDRGELLADDAIARADAALGAAVQQSRELRELGEELLHGRRGGQYEEIAVLLLAAAAVDSAVAADGLMLGPDPLEPDPELVERAGRAEVEPVDDIIAEVDELYRPFLEPARMGGAQDVDRVELLVECAQALDRLVEVATGPAMCFGFGAVAVGGAQLSELAAAQAVSKLDSVASVAGPIRRRAVRLLADGLRKLLAVAGERLVDEGLDALREGLRSPGQRLLGVITGRAAAGAKVRAAIARPEALSAEPVDRVREEVRALTAAYVEQMKWAGRTASWIARLSSVISALAAPVGGPLVVVALDGIGLGFVVYTLAVRLDDTWLPARVDAVVTIVERL